MSGLIETREDFDRLMARADKLAADLKSGKVKENRLGKGPSNRRAGTFEVYHFDIKANYIDGKSGVELWYGNESNWRKQMQDAILKVRELGREPQIVIPQCWTGLPAKHTKEQLEYDRAMDNSNLWTPDSDSWHFKFHAKETEMTERNQSIDKAHKELYSGTPKAQDAPFEQKPQPGSKYPMVVDIESKSEPGKIYHVTIENEDGFAICECKGFQYRKNCRHCKAARQQVFGEETSQEVPPDKVTEDDVALDSTLEDLLGG